jgi:hypothetical protein
MLPMHSIRDIVQEINSSLTWLPVSSEANGIAELLLRDDVTIPVINDRYVGIDDIYPVRIYHRLNSLTSGIKTGTGTGRSVGDNVNTYQISMVVFLDQPKACMYPDELLLFAQANTPERLTIEPFKSVVIAFGSTVFDSLSVYRQEYVASDTYRLKENQFFFKINYSIETTFSKGCFKQCP